MTFPLFWFPRRRSLTSRVNRLARPDARPDWAAELLPHSPQGPMEASEQIDPFDSETVAIPNIPEPFSAMQEGLVYTITLRQ